MCICASPEGRRAFIHRFKRDQFQIPVFSPTFKLDRESETQVKVRYLIFLLVESNAYFAKWQKTVK